MWTTENRSRYDRSRLRYPSDMTDVEWALIAGMIPPTKRGGNARTVNLREVVNGLLYVLGTGCQWRAIPRMRFSSSRTRLTGTTSSSALTASCPPSAMRRLHWNSRLGETPWNRATAETVMPG